MNKTDSRPHADEQAIIMQLRQLKMSGMADAFERQLTDPNADLRSFVERFQEIVGEEWQNRYNKKLSRYLKDAKLRYPQADFDDTVYDKARKLDTAAIEALATCNWIDEGKSLLITGMTGSGKTYIGNALCVAALRKLKRVLYIKASTLIETLAQSRFNTEKDTFLDLIGSFSKYDLLTIDDFGLMDLDPDKCRDLFEVIDSREGRRSTIIISQFAVKDWFDMFQNKTYADACMSRLTDKHNSYRLEMNGMDMRKR